MKSRRSLLVALTLILALVLAACGSSDSSETTTSADSAPASGADEGATTEVALVAPTASGGQIDFNDLQGSPTMLWFWAPW